MGFGITIPEGERGFFLSGNFGPNNYGAGRVITIDLLNTGSSVLEYRLANVSVDNEIISLGKILDPATDPAAGAVGLPIMPMPLSENNRFLVTGASLIVAEALTAQFYIATRSARPLINIVGTDVTLSTNIAIQV